MFRLIKTAVSACRRRAFVPIIVAALPWTTGAFAQSPTPWPTTTWPETTPEAQGMASSAVAELVDFGAANQMDSLLITRHGAVVADVYYAPFQAGSKHAVNSTTKGVVGTLTGMAIQDGLLASRDVPVIDFLADKNTADIDPDKKTITVGHLLDMTSGIDWKERLDGSLPESLIAMNRSRDWQKFVLDRPMAAAPGTRFNYDSGNSQLLSSILARTTGGSTLAYARRRFFGPLGITDVRWAKDPSGVEIGGYGLFLQPRDMAKIGYLYLRNGQWDGSQILPAAWVDQVFHATTNMGFGDRPAFRYSNGWWTIPSLHAYMTVGFLHQMIVVLPDIDVVAVVTGRFNYRIPALIEKINAAAQSGQPLPERPDAQQRLAERIRQASVERPTAVNAAPALAADVSGKVWEFDRNAMGVKQVVLRFIGADPGCDVTYANGRFVAGPMGLEGVFKVSEQTPGVPIGLKGDWVDPQTFRMVSRNIDEGNEIVYTVRFDGSAVKVAFQSNSGFRGELAGRLVQ